jgi:hypothetical protein
MNTRRSYIFQTDNNLRALPERVITDVVGNQPLLQTSQVEISTIPEELCTMVGISNMQWVSA